MPENRCPRCGGLLGERPARSRLTADREVLICTPCGTDEAVREATGRSPIPFDDWPLRAG
ncbi:hypothetical protein IAG44_20495 [Streptomyces roseirectus]|uniref:Uncharacterized protein n=1 Tax=Streptomyces roseirectus TaxID=2768066 RepID=A0A7H0IFK7_9ACTN|nr:hypothetical protein [Streptomyces roseirectus]QNP71573.1 hypothetical protein IAG44_20495 [Streptomyces roseirectus]